MITYHQKTFSSEYQDWMWYLLIAVLTFFSFYYAVGSIPLFDNNEGLYASIAKSMVLTKQFIIPYLNCVPYIEKPPLLYWLMAGSFSVFGFSALAARLVTVTSAALIPLFLILFARRIQRPQIGIISAIIFVSSICVSIIARMVYFDMLFTALISGALLCWFYWCESQQVFGLRLGYLFLGLAVLTKGLIAIVIVGGSFSVFLLLEKNYRSFYRIFDPLGIALFLAIVLPWHIAATIKHKGFFWHYIVEEHFLRFLNQREPHDYYTGPIYYYLPRIFIYLLPWSFFLPWIFGRTEDLPLKERSLIRFCRCWFFVPLIFFSLSSAKANYYMIVSVPAISILLGIKLDGLIAKDKSKTSAILGAALAFLIVLSVMFFINISQLPHPTGVIIVFALAYCVAIGILMLIFVNRGKVALILFASLVIPMVISMVALIKDRQDELSTAKVGEYLNSHAQGKNLYLYQDFENISALAFYAPCCFKIIDSKSSDLYYGQHLSEFKQWFADGSQIAAAKAGQNFYLVATDKLSQFFDYVGRNKFSIVENFGRITVLQ